MKTLLLLAGLALAPSALAQDSSDEEPEETQEETSEFSYVSDDKVEKEWRRIYRQGHSTSLGGAIGFFPGAVGMTTGIVLLGDMRCAPQDGVCTGEWVGEGFVVVGGFIAHAATIGLSSGALRASKSARKELGVEISSAPGWAGVIFAAAAVGAATQWVGLAKPTDALPPMPYVKNANMMYADTALMAVSWGAGFAQYQMATKHRQTMMEAPGVAVQVVPFTERGQRGVMVAGTF